jgi:hypothetical protein
MSISRGRLSFALVLIGLGTWQLAINISPSFRDLVYSNQYWPINVVGFGAFLALIGLVTWSPGWFIPACIIAGIGGLLYYQNITEDWSSWAYAWSLIPGFVAVGLLLLGLATWKRGPVIAAGWTLFGSMVLFGIFGSTLGGLPIAGSVGAAAVILLGLMFLITPLLRKKQPPQ